MKKTLAAIGVMWSNPLGLLGVTLTTVSGVLILVAISIDILGLSLNPYNALVAYIFLPMVFATGLLLIPIGVWVTKKFWRKSTEEDIIWRIDLSIPTHRRMGVFVLAMTLVNSIILSVALYEGYHYTDSVEFCGKLCHSVMKPEYTAYMRSPHARVTCVDCHIGSGASWFVKSKLSGMRQVYGVLAGDHNKPVPSPVEDLRPARDTCEACHWPEAFHGKKLATKRSLAEGATPADPLVSALLMNIGGKNERTGKYEGIHWHVSTANTVEYLASDDKRMKLKRVRARRPDGKTEEFVKDGIEEPPAGKQWRTMDCIDCHNRPTHIFEPADEAVDSAIFNGRVPADIPGIREAALAAVKKDYPDGTARAGIERHLFETLRGKQPEAAAAREADIRKAAAALAATYEGNVFPSMKIGWGTYPSHIGHRDNGGCFRCHDEEHKSDKGHVIGQDCDICHEVMSEKTKASALDDRIRKFIK
ncbi:MAG: NapC/NirT family cytochrome c [Deltaproteobacteria bacterium]|nr:NapC/NirT family cytochrome c [Deltaproteobacteria bacterium]